MGAQGIAYYVSAHGYGHGVRSSDIVRSLNAHYPEIPVTVVSRLPHDFLLHRFSPRNRIRAAAFDVGMVQLDSIRVDVPATLSEIERLMAGREELIRRECDLIRRDSIGLVVVDIPSLPLQAAARAGVPGLAVGNFSWDWIYSSFVEKDSRWSPVVEGLAEGYARADLLLRLPFSHSMDAFPRIEDIPLLAEPGKERREEIADLSGADPDRRWVLLSFTTLDWDEDALRNVGQLPDHEFFTVLPLEWKESGIHAIDRSRIPFSDVLASVDAVVSKPGFGIVSECAVNNKPLLYADRGDFLEYPILVRAIERHLRSHHLPSDRLYRGDLQEGLERLRERPDPPAAPERGGAIIAARRMAGYLGR